MAAGNLVLCPNIRENARLPDWKRSALVGYFLIILAFWRLEYLVGTIVARGK
jgi:hypothetical protein